MTKEPLLTFIKRLHKEGYIYLDKNNAQNIVAEYFLQKTNPFNFKEHNATYQALISFGFKKVALENKDFSIWLLFIHKENELYPELNRLIVNDNTASSSKSRSSPGPNLHKSYSPTDVDSSHNQPSTSGFKPQKSAAAPSTTKITIPGDKDHKVTCGICNQVVLESSIHNRKTPISQQYSNYNMFICPKCDEKLQA